MKKKVTLESCYSQNNFQKIYFFLYKQTYNIARNSDWARNIPKKLYLNLQSATLPK